MYRRVPVVPVHRLGDSENFQLTDFPCSQNKNTYYSICTVCIYSSYTSRMQAYHTQSLHFFSRTGSRTDRLHTCLHSIYSTYTVCACNLKERRHVVFIESHQRRVTKSPEGILCPWPEVRLSPELAFVCHFMIITSSLTYVLRFSYCPLYINLGTGIN
jgi:hypothetical protein